MSSLTSHIPTSPDQPLSPEEVAQIRRHFAKYIVECMPSIRRGLLGQEHWTTQRLGLFKTVASKVIPDLNASFSQHHHVHEDLTRLSRAELERIASGIAHASPLIEQEEEKVDLQAEVAPVDPLPRKVEALPDPLAVTVVPDPRVVDRPVSAPAKVDARKLGPPVRPKPTRKQLQAKAKRLIRERFPEALDPARPKMNFSNAYRYWAYPPDGGEAQFMGVNPKEWCERNRFDQRAVARVAHGYPNVSNGTPYIPKSVRGWGFVCKPKHNCIPRDARDADPMEPPPSILPRKPKEPTE